MRHLQEVEDLHSLRTLVVQDLKELGVKAPKWKKNKGKDDLPQDPGETGVFGCHLDRLPCLLVEGCGLVPKFLIDAVNFLEKYLDAEGLFRKSGSVARQKELRERIESGEDLGDALPLDIASLMKQFFRELPEPLLTSRLHDIFIKCYSLENESKRNVSLLLLCLMLPWQHLCTLRFIMLFLATVASHCENNKMDVQNLAVCLAPNFIHNHGNKGDKMTGNESRMLEVQRSIIEVLIENAQSIGMVSESLYHRVQMLSSCFPASEDELDRSCEQLDDTDNSKAGKKKKRRSGSLQGLVSNLSSSFSKWRRESKGHNQSNMSDKSAMMSMVSDQVDASLISADSDTIDGMSSAAQIMMSDVTPKVMRKRKASNEMMPFSATKKKAILLQMPQMSALANTPYTPMTKSRVRGHEFSLDTPSIKFAEGGSHMVFNATPSQTPRKNLEKLSPNSSSKAKRPPPSKSGCFSPNKSNKGKGRSVKRFLRRLSGGKDPQPLPANGLLDSEEAAARLAAESAGLQRGPPLSPGAAKKKSIFKRHRKTPSSPARLVTHLKGAGGVSVQEDPTLSRHNQESMTNLQLALQLQKDLHMNSPPQAADTSQQANSKDSFSVVGGIRRGKPNTVSTGLPSDRYQPSPNRSRRSMDGSMLAPQRHSSQRDIFGTPEKPSQLDCDGGVIDTSPILNVGPLVHDLSPVAMQEDFEEDDDELESDTDSESDLSDDEDESPVSSADVSVALSSKPSSASLVSTCLSEHDQAFIQDCTVLGEGEEGTKVTEDAAQSTQTQQHFKEPTAVAAHAPTKLGSKSDIKPTNSPAGSDAASTAGGSGKCSLSTSISTDSIDSAIEAGAAEQREMSKCASINSLKSCDSGLGGDVDGQQSPHGQSPAATNTITQQTSFLKENREAVGLQRTRRSSGDPKLQVTADMHQLLCKGGVISDSKPTPFKALPETSEDKPQGPVAGNAAQTDNTDKELAEKKASPLRFPNAVSRRMGGSPIRIPTIFAKADAEAEKYRELAKSCVRPPSPKPGRRPNLPISTNLLRSQAVEDAKQKLIMSDTPVHSTTDSRSASPADTQNTEGGSPTKPTLKDTTNTDSATDIVATPRIKPLLLSKTLQSRTAGKVSALPTLSRQGPTGVRRCRSPVKPVKRLKGSPRSPRSPGSPHVAKSPKRHSGGPKPLTNISPIPGHVTNWDF